MGLFDSNRGGSNSFYGSNFTTNIDLRQEFRAVLNGRIDMPKQGRSVVFRRLTDNQCPICWSPNEEGSSRPNCYYCQGEGYQFHETLENMVLTFGAAPIYKPGPTASGAYPQDDYGYTDMSKGVAFCEYFVIPDYERYTLQQHKSKDKLYEVKVDFDGSISNPIVKTTKWKVITVAPWHGDQGRVEYLQLFLEKENVS